MRNRRAEETPLPRVPKTRKNRRGLASSGGPARAEHPRAPLQTLSKGSQAGIFIIQAGKIRYINPSLAESFGSSRDKLIGRSPRVFVHPDDRAGLEKEFRELVEGRTELVRGEFRGPEADPKPRVYRFLGRRVEYDGRPALRCDILDAADRRQTEESLRQSEARYHQLFDLSPDAIVIHRKDKIILANAAALKLLGAATMDDLLGKPILDFVHPDFRDRVVDRTRRLIADGEPIPTLEEKFLRLDGMSIDVEVATEPIHDQNGLASLTIFRDITKRKKAEDALRENEQRYQILFEGANDAIFLMDGEMFLDCNEMTLRVYGCSSREDIIGHSPWEFSPAQQPDGRDSMDKAREVIQAALAGQPQRFYWVHTKKDRTPFDAEVSLNRFTIGAHTFLQAIVRDRTERRQAELLQTAVNRITQAADTAAGLDDLFRSVHEIISTVMPAENFYIALYNEAQDLLSFPYYVDEFDAAPEPSKPGKGLTEYVLRTGKSLLCDKVLDRELRMRGEVELVGAPAEIWLGVPLRLENKTTGAMVVQHYSDPMAYGRRDLLMLEYVSSQVAKSIERKAAQEDLEKSEAFHRRIIETAAGVPFQLYSEGSTGEGSYRYIGPGIQKLLGLSPEEFTERRFHEIVEEWIPLLPGIPGDFAECRRKMLRGEIPRCNADLRVRTADGQVKWLNESSLPLLDETSGKVIGAYGLLLDITERKRAEEALRESETKFRAVFENSVDAIGVSKAGRHVFINPSYLSLFGYDHREELIGRPILNLIAPD